MAPRSMPAAELSVDCDQLRAMLRRQVPALADEAIELVANGWDNAVFRVGETRLARLPRRRAAVPLIEHEIRWLPRLAPGLPLPVPVPEFVGRPSDGYPWPWTIVAWIDGELLATAEIDVELTARSLGEFLAALHRPAPTDAPANPVRGVPLTARRAATCERLDLLRDLVDVDRLSSLWAEVCDVPPYDGHPVWLHGDFHPMNVLVADRAPCGVIDFGDLTAGDPATDLSIAWIQFPDATTRRILHDAYGGVDAATDARARGWALTLGTAYLAHGADHPTMSAIGERTLGHVLPDGPR